MRSVARRAAFARSVNLMTTILQAHPELATFIAIVLGFAIGRVRHRREHMVALTRLRL